MIALIDYDAGDLTPLTAAFLRLNADVRCTRDPEEVEGAERVILPGFGSARAAMDALQRFELDRAVVVAAASGKPLLGICLGSQLFFAESEEDGGTLCLEVIAGRVERFRFRAHIQAALPHLGDDPIHREQPHPLLEGLDDSATYYFEHSYFAQPYDPSSVQATSVYGDVVFPAVHVHRNIAGVQFHPETSGEAGDRFLSRFLAWNPPRESS